MQEYNYLSYPSYSSYSSYPSYPSYPSYSLLLLLLLLLLLQEYKGRGLTLSTLDETPLTLYGIWLMLLLDVVLYFALAKYLSQASRP